MSDKVPIAKGKVLEAKIASTATVATKPKVKKLKAKKKAKK